MYKKKIVRIVIGVFLVILVSGFLGGGWFASNLLRDGGLIPDHTPDELDLVIENIGSGLITLRATELTDRDGDWNDKALSGLMGDDFYLQIGETVEESGDTVVRKLLTEASSDLTGRSVRTDAKFYPDDPLVAHGMAFTEVTYASELGEFPAWFVDGDSSTWAIFVHGKSSDRRESLRTLPVIAKSGMPMLVISYRNDEDTVSDPSGMYGYGLTEWEDLEGAVLYALDNGARRIVLVGYSMGGGIVTSFLLESSLAGQVSGAILDSPMLDFGATVELGAEEDGYPVFVGKMAKLFSGFRFGVDWASLNYLDRADELALPILLFHGTEDHRVPISTSRSLAALRPRLVTYVELPGVDHVRGWNADRDAYESAVSDFLKSIMR
ncbi:MAG: alpha/beta hydrolase [Chloroflexi bacterium]|nr:alpha/beta hydrolase [Chloroflexota bacterium]